MKGLVETIPRFSFIDLGNSVLVIVMCIILTTSEQITPTALVISIIGLVWMHYLFCKRGRLRFKKYIFQLLDWLFVWSATLHLMIVVGNRIFAK